MKLKEKQKKQIGILSVVWVCCFFIMLALPQINVSAATELDPDTIVNYVNSRVGTAYPNGYCLKFVEECYQNLGGKRPYQCCAYKSGSTYIKSTSRDNIPNGATVYFGACGGGPCRTCGSQYYGHVGIYVGNGYFVHATGGKVQKSTISSWSNKYRGWGYCGNFSLKSSVKPFHINIDSPKAGVSTTSGITAEGWAIYGNGVTNITCNINGNTYNCSRKSRPDVANAYPGYPTGNEGFSYYIPEYLMHPGTNQLTFTAYNGNTVLGSSTRTFQYNMTASKTLSDGLYTIVSAVNNNSVFDIEWASMVDEGNLVISNRNGGNNQKFDVTYLGNGYYKIEAHHSKKALDVYNASTERLANVQQCGYHGGMNQKWILRSAGDGYYYIISANNGMYMDLPNADISPGNSIWMNWGNGSPAEKWKFESTTEKREEYNFTYINCDGSRTYLCGPGSTIRIRADQIKNGKRFKKFQVKSGNVKIDNEYSTSITVTMPESDLIIEAVYETIPTYKVTFNSNGGTVSGTGTKTVTSGEKYGTLPTATKSGYTFDGWYTSGSGGTRITENTTVSLTGNQTLYAHWIAVKKYGVTIYNGTGNKTEMYPAGTSVRVKADSLENGMEFSKWVVLSGNIKLENESDIETSFTMPERSVVIQAVYEKSQADTDAGTDTDTDTGTDTDAGKDADTGKTDTPEADTEQDDEDDEEDESDLWTEFISGKIRYEVMDGKEAAVVGLKTKQVTKVKIPSTVSYDGRIYKVTEISDYAFKKSSVTEVVIADSVKEIGTSAFLGCKKLVKVTIGANTTKIGTKAFKDCGKLKNIIVRSKKLKRIGKNAFSGIRKNAQIKVPAAQYKKYKKLFKGKGQGKKVVLKKYSGK